MIAIAGVSQEVTAFKKYLNFEYEGKVYDVVLYWDEHNGYDLWFKSESKTPDWALNWEENHPEEDGLYTLLDNLSEEAGE